MGITLPLPFLKAAAPGYMTDTDWDGLAEDWLEQGLAYTATSCKGIRGPLTPIRPRAAGSSTQVTGPAYRLADYLEQHGRHTRGAHNPPAESWKAAARFASPLAEQPNRPGWWHRYNDILPDWFQTYVAMEEVALFIRVYEPQLIPGLLQTEAYSTAVISRGDFPIEQAEQLVVARKERQNRFREGMLKLWVILDETALRRPAAGTGVQLEQLRYLRTACGSPALTLQVLPYGAGGLASPTGFSILRFAERDLPDVVYVEHLTSALYLDEHADVDSYKFAMDRLTTVAHAPRETPKLLDWIIADLETAPGA
jgi:hypothetical protein